jgi:hypothetical protein
MIGNCRAHLNQLRHAQPHGGHSVVRAKVAHSHRGLGPKPQVSGPLGKCHALPNDDTLISLTFCLWFYSYQAMSKILKTHPKSVLGHKDLVMQCLDDSDESIRLRVRTGESQ